MDDGMMDDEVALDDMMLAQMLDEEGMGASDDSEAMLAQMLDEEGMGMMASEDKKAEALLAEMMGEMKAAAKSADEDEEEEESDDSDDSEESEEAEEDSSDDDEDEADEGSDKEAAFTQDVFGIELTAGSLDQPEITEQDAVLASLFADDKFASDDEEEGSDKEAGLNDEIMAAMKPQPKKASTGATSIGSVKGMPRTAKAEVQELTNLWDAPPDVSEFFSTGNF
jgi:chemotaxis protein histidine kinase CheA